MVGLVARTYVADALGALLGGVLFTFVLIRWLGPVQTLGLTVAALALTAALFPHRPGALRAGLRLARSHPSCGSGGPWISVQFPFSWPVEDS